MKAVVILPTYNEKENLAILIPKIFSEFKGIKHDMHLLVADDSSPDGTADLVLDFSKKNKKLHLLLGKKEGLGVAYLRAFDYAIDKLEADVMFMMDADMSHPPELIPEFMREMELGHDVVIGSRYIRGGGTPDWSSSRKLISKTGNLFARIIGGLKVNDCTSGFRAIRTSVYKKIEKSHLHTRGYAFLTTLLYELIAAGAKIREIPLVFYDRKFGETKLQRKDMVEFFLNTFRLRLKSSKRFIKFAITGATGTVVNLGILFMLVEKLSIERRLIAPSIALEVSIIWNFFLNNYWTFKDTGKKSSFPAKLAKFHITALAGFFLNLVIYNACLQITLLSSLLGRYDFLAAQFIAILIVMSWNYVVNVKWTWRE
ncbi:MAG: glycosyltransferase family 2 protein [Nanoarchaeota archaeon]|nr:glycosyltransferase family 2 protein [Nanoarchaeota archaeon]